MKLNKYVYIGIAVVVIVIVGVVSFIIYNFQGNSSAPAPINTGQNVKTLSPSDIGLTATVRPDKKGIVLTISKLTGISSIEYSLSYDANVTDAGQSAVVPRGVEGSPVQINPGDTQITRNIDLGTCSKNVCKYDDVVSDITVTIRVNYKNGTVGGVEEKIKLNS